MSWNFTIRSPVLINFQLPRRSPVPDNVGETLLGEVRNLLTQGDVLLDKRDPRVCALYFGIAGRRSPRLLFMVLFSPNIIIVTQLESVPTHYRSIGAA